MPDKMEIRGNLRVNWNFFQSQWENYEIATQLNEKDDTIRVASLLSIMGKECFRIYKHLDITKEDRKKTKTILEAMKKHFEPQVNVIYERYIFNTTDQESTEGVDQYVTKLRQLAESCDFRTLNDELIRDRIVLGTKDSAARARMLREPKLDLKKAINMCRSSETAEKQHKKIGTDESKDVHFSARLGTEAKKKTQEAKQTQGSDRQKCKYCGGSHAREKSACPAYQQNCGKMNHFARVCKKNARKPHTSHYRAKQKPRAHFVDDDSYTEEFDSSTDESVCQITHCIGAVKTKGKQWFIHLNMRMGRYQNDIKYRINMQSHELL